MPVRLTMARFMVDFMGMIKVFGRIRSMGTRPHLGTGQPAIEYHMSLPPLTLTRYVTHKSCFESVQEQFPYIKEVPKSNFENRRLEAGRLPSEDPTRTQANSLGMSVAAGTIKMPVTNDNNHEDIAC